MPQLISFIRKYPAFLVFVAIAGFFVVAALVPEQPQPVAEERGPQCRKAAGYIMSDVRLYRDPSCNQLLGTIYGIGDIPDRGQGVVIDYENGAREWKQRDAVTQQSYVMDDDPALRLNLYRSVEYR